MNIDNLIPADWYSRIEVKGQTPEYIFINEERDLDDEISKIRVNIDKDYVCINDGQATIFLTETEAQFLHNILNHLFRSDNVQL